MPTPSAADLARLIQRDIALAGQVMRVANSAVYARRNPVVTLPQAIAWLGIREVRNIAFAVALKGQVFNSAYFRHEMADLWRESVITRCSRRRSRASSAATSSRPTSADCCIVWAWP